VGVVGSRIGHVALVLSSREISSNKIAFEEIAPGGKDIGLADHSEVELLETHCSTRPRMSIFRYQSERSIERLQLPQSVQLNEELECRNQAHAVDETLARVRVLSSLPEFRLDSFHVRLFFLQLAFGSRQPR
jgi:hypothetical protein